MQKTEWEVCSDQEIRVAFQDNICPLAFVATVATGHKYDSDNYRKAGKALGFNGRTSDLVMRAADNCNRSGQAPKLRKIMEKALNL
jgi:hypothetical protein